jgi:nucleolar protein 58
MQFAFVFIFLRWCNARCIQVNEQIIATARILFKCDDVEKKEYQNLCLTRHYLKKVSGIDYESWDPLKLATAFKIISRSEAGDSDKVLLTYL